MSSEQTTIKIHEGNYRLVMAHFILGHRTINNQYLSFERSLYIRALYCRTSTLNYHTLFTVIDNLQSYILRGKSLCAKTRKDKDMIDNINDIYG